MFTEVPVVWSSADQSDFDNGYVSSVAFLDMMEFQERLITHHPPISFRTWLQSGEG